MGSMNSEDENWYACSDWLERCSMITVEQNKSISSIEHLATILKDGVLLCNLCNKIKPGSIDIKQTSQKPQYSQFLWQRNVHTFLMACQNAFGLDKKKHLFEVPDLVELQNFGKVIFTLSKLSQTKEARAKNIKPFTAKECAKYVIVKDMLVEDDDSFSLYGTSLDDLGNSDVCEELYDTLIYGSMQKPAAKASTPRTMKDSCLDELVVTEKNFIDVLAMIHNIFARNLKSHLSASESNEVFFKIEDLHKVHQDFYRKISVARNSVSPAQEVSKSFIEFKLPFTIYGDYVAHINRSTAALDAICTTNSPARKLIEEGAIVAKVKLRDLLTVPVQRILKYHIIIKELMKLCSSNQDEMNEIKRALEAAEDLNVYINEVKRDSENLDTTREVQSSIVDIRKYFSPDQKCKLEVYGRRHFDGEFKVKCVSEPKPSYDNRYVFLFDRVVIICKPVRNSEYEYKGVMDMEKCTISNGPVEKGIQVIKLSEPGDRGDVYYISAKKAEQITKLKTFLEIVKDNLLPNGHNNNNHDFVLTTFHEATTCTVCGKLLRGLLSQGYRCKKTQKIVHKECLSKATSPANTFSKSAAPSRRSPAPQPQPPPSKSNRPNVVAAAQPVEPPRIRRPAPDPNNYRNSDPRSHVWFSTASSRQEANKILKNMPDGTFLVRWSEEQKRYVISMKCETLRHIKINETERREYNLKPAISFKNVPDLIAYYRANSLHEIFPTITMPLKQVYSEVKGELVKKKQLCRAIYNFSASGADQLSFEEGDVIEIISKRENCGWWKGMLRDKKGYFPNNYVEEMQ